MSFTLDVSAEFGLPNLSYCSISACGFMSFFAIKKLIDRGTVPLKNEEDLTNGYLDSPGYGVLGLKNMRLRDFTNFTGDSWTMSFVMPSKYGENLPLPKDTSIRIKKVPQKIVAAVDFSGFVTDEDVKKRESKLRDALGKDSLFQVNENAYVEISQDHLSSNVEKLQVMPTL